jgi:hypothetical protein
VRRSCDLHVTRRYIDTHPRPRDLLRPSFASSRHPPLSEGAGKTGCRPGTHGPLCEACASKKLHSGIQVKPNTRPSLRSGLTAYAVLSPGSDALLPPSPCGWLMDGPGRAAASPQDLTHRLRASGPHGFAVRRPHPSLARRLRSRFPALRCRSRRCGQRPPRLTPRFVTIAIRPSDWGEVAAECVKAEFL